MKKGFTVLEILTSIAILGALCLISVWHFTSATKAEALAKDRQGLVALLSEARSLSLASKEALPYGVHLEEFQAILFKGPSYSAGNAENITQSFHSAVHLSNYSITGGGSDIIFSRLTGATLNDGTIRLALQNNSLSSTTITVKNTGVIE
jgi:prepilin-type N-terminal cleavage/methylation domain-containing protein